MATKKTAKKPTTKTKTTAKTAAKKPAAKPAAKKPAATTTPKSAKTPATSTQELAALLKTCKEAVEVKIPEENGIAVRLATRQLEVPLLVHVGELTVFDLYPFRFVGVDVARVDWVKLIRFCRTGYIQLGLDNDFDDDDVLVYSFHMPLASLDESTVQTVISTLTSFAEDHYDEALNATGLVEKKKVH